MQDDMNHDSGNGGLPTTPMAMAADAGIADEDDIDEEEDNQESEDEDSADDEDQQDINPGRAGVDTDTVSRAIDQGQASHPTWGRAFKGVDAGLVEEYACFAAAGRLLLDGTNLCRSLIGWSGQAVNIMYHEHANDPANYTRANAIERLRMAMVIEHVPMTYLPQVLVATLFVAKIDSSTLDSDNGSRSWHDIPDDFYRGNMSFYALRAMSTLIRRHSKKNENECWEIKHGMEDLFSNLMRELKLGHIGVSQVRAIIKAEAKMSADAGKTEDDFAADLAEKREKAFSTLATRMGALRKFAAVECGLKTQDQFTQYLINRVKLITKPPTPKVMALTMTPGDMVEVIQTLVSSAATDRTRSKVLRAITNTLMASQAPKPGEVVVKNRLVKQAV